MVDGNLAVGKFVVSAVVRQHDAENFAELFIVRDA